MGSVSTISRYAPITTSTTHVFSDDSPKTRDPQQACAAYLIHEQTFAREEGFADALILHIFDYALRRSHVGVLADIPYVAAGKSDSGYITQERWCHQDLSWTCIRGRRHLCSGDKLLHGKFNCTFKHD